MGKNEGIDLLVDKSSSMSGHPNAAQMVELRCTGSGGKRAVPQYGGVEYERDALVQDAEMLLLQPHGVGKAKNIAAEVDADDHARLGALDPLCGVEVQRVGSAATDAATKEPHKNREAGGAPRFCRSTHVQRQAILAEILHGEELGVLPPPGLGEKTSTLELALSGI
ncbi:hypothetical protein B0H19DRAFT_1084044 [Mycena capillaripes]|nr:hypothetical protein B0H19DRAFT_1084044 [Mycena capillaripes]